MVRDHILEWKLGRIIQQMTEVAQVEVKTKKKTEIVELVGQHENPFSGDSDSSHKLWCRTASDFLRSFM